MRTFIRWASRVYPATWRARYGGEFDALLEDTAPSFWDLCDVLGHALRVCADQFVTSRLLVLTSVTAHASILGSLVLAAWLHVTPMPLNVAAAPLPPPAPDPPPRITDPRVFPEAGMLYSSLPVGTPAGGVPFASVVNGVGINFPPLPDAWATNQSLSPERRIWPGQALERAIARRVLPDYPSGTAARGTISVFIEYLIAVDGSVKVLRTSGPTPFAAAARSAIERWSYRPVRCDGGPCEVVTRIEVRFDGDLANADVCDRPNRDEPVLAWLPLVLGGLVSAIVALTFCPVPRLQAVSGPEALFLAATYMLATVAAGASVAVTCALVTGWRTRERRAPRSVLWSFSVATAWVPPVVAFYIRDSLWAVSTVVIFAALGSRLICRFRRMVGEVTPRRRGTALLPLGFAALLLELAALCVLASMARYACLLIGSATFVIAFRWQSASALEQQERRSRWENAIRSSIAVGLALVFVAGSLSPYLEPPGVSTSSTKVGATAPTPPWKPILLAGNAPVVGRPGTYRVVQALFGETNTDPTTESGLPERKPRPARTVEGDSYPGMILRPGTKEHVTLVPPPPFRRVFGGIPHQRNRDPVSIPFYGAYWFYRTSDKALPVDAIESRGDPASTSFKTTDFTPISMEAHQNLGRLIDLSCCRAIEVIISNGDRRPGTVVIELTVVNTRLPRHPRQSLGTAPVKSTLRWFPGDDRPPVPETLTFRVPAHPAIQQFDEIAIHLESMSPREQWSAKIAIDSFRFVRSGL